jgi:hypothetical protein
MHTPILCTQLYLLLLLLLGKCSELLCSAQVARYGQYRGYCSLGVMCQSLENRHLRAALRMPSGVSGVLINNVQQTSSASQACCGGVGKGEEWRGLVV